MNRRNVILTLCFLLALVAVPLVISATEGLTDYQLLEPLPFDDGGQLTTKTTAPEYIAGLFRLTIALAGVLAVLMLIYGGFIKLSSDAFSQQNKAKEIISNAIWGLLFAMGAWVIVATLLPTKDGKLTFDLSLPTIPTPKDTNKPGETGSGPSNLSQEEVMRQFKNAGVTVVGGLRLDGLQQSTINEVVSIKNQCGCNVTVTSATGGEHESGQYSHANGYKVDLRSQNEGKALTDYITRNYTRIQDRKDGTKMYRAPSGALYGLESNHWDVTVPG